MDCRKRSYPLQHAVIPPRHTTSNLLSDSPRAVRLGAWMKRTFSLKPALNKIRESRKDFRGSENLSKQVEHMR